MAIFNKFLSIFLTMSLASPFSEGVNSIFESGMEDFPSEKKLDKLNKMLDHEFVCPSGMVNDLQKAVQKEPNWRKIVDKLIPIASKMMHKCEQELGPKDEDVKELFEFVNDALDCMRGSGNKMRVVAIIFIVAFILALAGLVAMAVLLLRRK